MRSLATNDYSLGETAHFILSHLYCRGFSLQSVWRNRYLIQFFVWVQNLKRICSLEAAKAQEGPVMQDNSRLDESVHFLCEFSSRYMHLRITPGRLPQATLPYFSTYRKWNRIWRQKRASCWAYITDLGWQKASVTRIRKPLAGSHQCFQKEAMTQTWTRLCLIWFYQDS